MTDTKENEAQVIASMAEAAAKIREVGDTPFIMVPRGYEVQDLSRMKAAPQRISACVRAEREESFSELVNEFKDHRSRLYISQDSFLGGFTVIVDDAAKGQPSWRDHRIIYRPEESPVFSTWMLNADRVQSLKDFANFLQINRMSIVEPDAASLVGTIRDLKAVAKVEIHESVDEFTGSKAQSYAQTVTLKSAKGDVSLPASFVIRVPVYKGQKSLMDFTCLIRCDVDDGKVKIGYTIDLLTENLETLSEMMAVGIAEAVELKAFYVSP